MGVEGLAGASAAYPVWAGEEAGARRACTTSERRTQLENESGLVI